MKRTILIIFVLCFVNLTGYSQMVYTDGGKIYLDCTIASKMPSGAITKSMKCKGGSASNETYRNGSEDNNIYAHENNEVFELLEIDATDFSNTRMDWATAYNSCINKDTNNWRLPTQRELMLMYIFRTQIGNFGADAYWSATETNCIESWNIDFSNGTTFPNTYKTEEYKVRCVKAR